jgi:WD40 repeat protein
MESHSKWPPLGTPDRPNGPQALVTSDPFARRLVSALGDRREGHQGSVVSASFSPDGTHVVTASADNTARVWRIFADVNKLILLVRVGLSRCLSQAQRDAYGLLSAQPSSDDRNFIPPPAPDGRCPG